MQKTVIPYCKACACRTQNWAHSAGEKYSAKQAGRLVIVYRFPNCLLRRHFDCNQANGINYFTKVSTCLSKYRRGVRFWFAVVMEKATKCQRSRQLGKVYIFSFFYLRLIQLIYWNLTCSILFLLICLRSNQIHLCPFVRSSSAWTACYCFCWCFCTLI